MRLGALARPGGWQVAGLVLLDVALLASILSMPVDQLRRDPLAPWLQGTLLVLLVVVVVVMALRRFRPLAAAIVGYLTVLLIALLPPPSDPEAVGFSVDSGPETQAAHLPMLLGALLFTVTVKRPWRVSRWFLVAAALLLLLPGTFAVPWGQPVDPSGVVIGLLVLVLCHLVALAVRRSRALAARVADYAAELERREGAVARAAVAEERVRIARELHDVLAHHVTVMSLHIEAADAHRERDPATAGRALATARESGHDALADMRALVGALRRPEDARAKALDPDSEHADTLARYLDRLDRSGLDVDLTETGERRPLPAIVDQAARRIVQESLTNVLQHAATRVVAVTVVWGGRRLVLRVRDSGVGAGPDARGGVPMVTEGYGLLGMRERAAAVGGTLAAGPRPGGGFEVFATLPLVTDDGPTGTSAAAGAEPAPVAEPAPSL